MRALRIEEVYEHTRSHWNRPRDGWIGVYNHSDSYPTWMGPRIWEYAQTIVYDAIEEAVLKGVNIITDRRELDGETFTSEDNDIQLGIQWVWVISPESLSVFTSAKTDELRAGQRSQWIEPFIVRTEEGNKQMGGYYYVHECVGAFPLSDPEPDWRILECGENLERCSHLPWVHHRSVQPDPAYSAERVEAVRGEWGV